VPYLTIRVGQNHIDTAYAVCLSGKSPNIRSYTVYTVYIYGSGQLYLLTITALGLQKPMKSYRKGRTLVMIRATIAALGSKSPMRSYRKGRTLVMMRATITALSSKSPMRSYRKGRTLVMIRATITALGSKSPMRSYRRRRMLIDQSHLNKCYDY